jgi:predicted RNA-binding protein YlxR (DUF448 family)
MARKRQHRKHVPQRTCVACRTVRPKRELIRIVCTPEGEILVDERGKRNGRGAYLCAQQACWEEALARQRLDAALRTSLDEATVTTLRVYAQTLPEYLSVV